MAFVTTFCFYFSSRLGSIIIGVFNLIQIIIILGIIMNEKGHTDELSAKINDLLMNEEYDMVFATDMLTRIKNYPDTYLNYGITFFVFFGVSCGLMIYGVYKLKSYIVYPFVVFNFIYITTLLILYISVLLIMKENEAGLGPLILFSILGEFLFLYKYYTWFVVVGYCQIIYELQKQIDKVKILEPPPAYSEKFSFLSEKY